MGSKGCHTGFGVRLAIVALVLLAGAAAVAAQSGTFGNSARPPAVRSYRLTVTSNVRNAGIWIDGVRQRQTTPATLTLRPGTYTVEVEARGYQTWRTRVTLDSNQTVHAVLVPPRATILLEIPSQFLNDRVRDPWRLIDFYLDDRLQRHTRIEVDPGYHRIAIVSGGLRIEQEFHFEAGRTYTIEAILRLVLSDRR